MRVGDHLTRHTGATLLFAIAALSGPGPAGAVLPDEIATKASELALRSTVRSGDAARQRALTRGPAWRSFTQRHGAWSVWWNEATATPHRAAGPGIALAGFADDSAAVDAAVRTFVAAHPELFLEPELETVAIQRIRGIWYARYRQRLGGVPVLMSDWEFRVGAGGRLMLFGADAYRGFPAALRAPRLARSVARSIATSVPGFRAGADRVDGGERLFLLPVVGETGIAFRPVYDFRVRTREPVGYWAVMVDAVTGETVQRENRVRHAITGHVTGDVHLVSPIQPTVTREFSELFVAVDAETVATDAAGLYSATSNSGTITAGLRGRFVDIDRHDAPDAGFSAPAPVPGNYDIAWNNANSHAAERDAYWHVTFAHADVKRIDPGLVRLDRPVACAVNITTGSCNGYWDGHNIGLYQGSAVCQNYASTPGVVYHEYGHAIGYERYRQAANDTLVHPTNDVLSEGTAEINAMMVLDDPVVGRDHRGPLTHQRTGNIEWRWPEDQSGTEYNTMFTLTGSFWDLRVDQGKPLAETLFHFAMYGLPDDPDDGVAMSEYFLETVVADDDDANLANGTPHLDAILRAFNPRGIGTSFFFTFGHTAIGDQPAGAFPIHVTATIDYAGPLGVLQAGSPTLFYSIDGGAWLTKPMTPTGQPDEFTAILPAPEGSLVRYYLLARDTHGGVATWPIGAPSRRPFAFLRGAPTVLFGDDMEIDRGWTVGAPTDSATGGVWVRVDPIATSFFDPVQPGDDHTAAGVTCWVTGNAQGHSNFADVDGGRTTLTSPLIDASTLADHVIEYYRWYFNAQIIEPDSDPWRVLLSNDDGATWVAIENTAHTENRWQRFLIRMADYLPPTSQMRVRFVARDTLGANTVEAAIDDFRLIGFVPSVVGVTPDPPVAELAIEPPHPNPTQAPGPIAFVLPSAGHARLSVFDVAGREVARPVDGALPAGRHVVAWDTGGHARPAGIYHVRLQFAGETRIRRLAIVR